jgi:hypothetical protein
MRSSSSRMMRPRSIWGLAVAGLALTFVVPASADDAAPAGKPAAPAATSKGPGGPEKGPKGPGLKEAMERRKDKAAGEKGEHAERPDGGKPEHLTRSGMGPNGKNGPHGKPGKPGAKQRLAPSPMMAKNQYGKAVAALHQAEAAAAAAPPEEADKAKKQLQAAQRAVRRAEKSLRAARRMDAMKMKNMNPEQKKKLDEKLQMRAKKLAEDRQARSKKRQDEVQKELGDKVKLAPVRAELERHAWRVARLERLIAIAEAAGRPEVATRAKALLDKEIAEHPARLKRATEGGKAGPKGPLGAPAAKLAAPAATPAVPNKPVAQPAKEGAQ